MRAKNIPVKPHHTKIRSIIRRRPCDLRRKFHRLAKIIAEKGGIDRINDIATGKLTCA